jgi:chromosome segregation ATPase
MIQKPPVDIEWYDDGFTMEEQAELRKEYTKNQKAVRPKLTVTKQQQEIWKDTLISKLKVENAANEEYIKELEEQIKQLQKANEEILNAKQQLSIKLNAMMDRYSKDINKYIQSEEFQQKYKNQIDELRKENKKLRQIKDDLIYKLCHNANV